MRARIADAVVAAAYGAILAAGTTAIAVNHMTAAPEQNPANQQILIYGD